MKEGAGGVARERRRRLDRWQESAAGSRTGKCVLKSGGRRGKGGGTLAAAKSGETETCGSVRGCVVCWPVD